MNSLFLVIILLISCNEKKTDTTNQKEKENITVQNVDSKDSMFDNFLEFFPELKLPYSSTDQKTNTFSAKANPALPSDAVSKYLCNKTFICVQNVGESEASDDSGFDIRNRFYPVGKVQEKEYTVLLYHLSYEGVHENFISTHDKKGNLISRLSFSGTNGNYSTLDGELNSDKKINLAFKTLTNNKKETSQKVKSESNTQFSFTTTGTILNSNTQKAIMDNARKYK